MSFSLAMILAYMGTIYTLLLCCVIATAAEGCKWTNITIEGGKIQSVNSDAVASVSNIVGSPINSGTLIVWSINGTLVAFGRYDESLEKIIFLKGNATFKIEGNNISSTLFLMGLPFEYDGADLSISDNRCGSHSQTKMHVQYCSTSEQRDAFNQHATVNITASSDKPAYKDKGRCSCGEGSLFFSNGTESIGDVWCNGIAQWEGCEDVQCWSAPSVFEVNQNQMFAGLPANLSCNYAVGFPNNTEELFYINGIKVDRAVTLNSSHFLQEYYCKAANEYTNMGGQEAPSSDNGKLIVFFEPENLSEVSKIYEIQILINESKIVMFSFRANDADDSVTATFHQLGGSEVLTPVYNASDSKTSYHYFSYKINVNTKSDYGEYIFIARTSRPQGSLNTTIKIVDYLVTMTPSTTTSGGDNGNNLDPDSNTLAIAVGCGAAGIVIMVLVVALIIYRRRKGKSDTEKKKEKEVKVDPPYQETPIYEKLVDHAYASIAE